MARDTHLHAPDASTGSGPTPSPAPVPKGESAGFRWRSILPKQLQYRTDVPQVENPERDRLVADLNREANWKRWGPYLSERQWGTVREDYSPDGSVWTYFPHEQARSRAYRWGEDGLLGITDRECRLCFAVALWNGKDPILKERLFGLTGPEGNHGEDVKEEYFYLDSTPTHSYMRAAYRYPHAEFPYKRLVEENAKRGKDVGEFEIADTGVFADNRFFDVQAEYAKANTDDILIRLTISNKGPDAATCHVLPTFWFRNTWVWGCTHEGCWPKPCMGAAAAPDRLCASKDTIEIAADHASLGKIRCWSEVASDGTRPQLLFTDNTTNSQRVFGIPNTETYLKDAFHDRVIHNTVDAVNPGQVGSKAAGWYTLNIPAGKSVTIRARITVESQLPKGKPFDPFGAAFEEVFTQRIAEMERFYSDGRLGPLAPEEKNIARQAYAGLLWSKQFYHYVASAWFDGDPGQPAPPPERALPGHRNWDWRHLYARDVISMPDKWEYPWFAAWDLAFHCVALAQVDPQFAKDQLLLVMREWYMHPSGAIPAYEFAFGDVNPPVNAWACWRVYKITGRKGERDRVFLARAFHKLLLNFTWWVNRKDPEGRNVFGGGFLGLDNIGVFDRSRPLPSGLVLEQADGTAWMAFFCGTMLSMALELASEDPAYEDIATKFFEHFIAIVDAMNSKDSCGGGLWDEEDGFYYDQLRAVSEKDGGPETVPLKVRSMVGIMPLMAVEVIEESTIDKLPGFLKRTRWFLAHRTELAKHVSILATDEGHNHALLAIPSRERLKRVLASALDEAEFLSPFGLRSVSKFHAQHPFVLETKEGAYSVSYVPGESTTSMFGGNSNWRGPVWFPLNYLFIEALERYHHFYGASFTIEYPTGSGNMCTLEAVSIDLRRRLAALFMPDGGPAGARPYLAKPEIPVGTGPGALNPVRFHEYFHGDTGLGLGASHQTGWTALVAPLLKDLAKSRSGPQS